MGAWDVFGLNVLLFESSACVKNCPFVCLFACCWQGHFRLSSVVYGCYTHGEDHKQNAVYKFSAFIPLEISKSKKKKKATAETQSEGDAVRVKITPKTCWFCLVLINRVSSLWDLFERSKRSQYFSDLNCK